MPLLLTYFNIYIDLPWSIKASEIVINVRINILHVLRAQLWLLFSLRISHYLFFWLGKEIFYEEKGILIEMHGEVLAEFRVCTFEVILVIVKMHLFFSFDLFYFPKASLRAITFLEENLAISFLLPEEQIYDFHSEFCMSCRARERRIIFHHMDDKSVLLLIFFDIITLGKSACEIRIPFVSFCVLFRRRTHGWRSHVCTENCTHDILLLIGATTKRSPTYPTSWWSKLGDELSTLHNILTMKGCFLNF